MKRDASTLSKVAGLTLDSAALNWQATVALELLAGAILIAAPVLHLSKVAEMIAAFTAAVVILVAKALKVVVDRKTAIGNSIRRRADFVEGLGWAETKRHEESVRRQVGSKVFEIAERVKGTERAYESSGPPGPARLCEMKVESAFWMSRVSQKVARFLTILAVFVTALTGVFLFLGTLRTTQLGAATDYFHIFYLIIPVIVSTDCIVWVFKARDLATESGALCDALVELIENGQVTSEKVMQIVADYDCAVAGAIPVPNWFFQCIRREVQAEWTQAKLIK